MRNSANKSLMNIPNVKESSIYSCHIMMSIEPQVLGIV
jgi:hypothetical protein